MEWMISSTDFPETDSGHFGFNSSNICKLSVVKIEGKETGEVEFQDTTLSSVAEYGAWIKRCRPSSLGPHSPTLLLAMHKRLEVNQTNDGFVTSTSLAYNFDRFRGFCRDLCQHRALESIIARVSTAIFSCKSVKWEGQNGFGNSIVYHCKSDTESLETGDDIVLSTTSFTNTPVTFAVMYGCTERIMKNTRIWLERCKGSVFHPLVLPMIFAEHERKRIFNAIDSKSTELEERILELEKRVKEKPKKEVGAQTAKSQEKQTMTQRDCEAIELWRSMSSLKNGLEGLLAELGSMRDHLSTLSESQSKSNQGLGLLHESVQGPEVYIDARLKEMMAEFRSKIRSCESLLGGMTLATQMEWNYYTRRDAQVNFSIATAARMDGSQMKQISLLGMIFLPGTFLATFFSMTFFSWIPDDSAQVISPWLGLYGGLTVVLTAVTVMLLNKWSNKEMENARETLEKELEQDSDSTLFSRFNFSRSSSSFRSKDVELGIVSR
ncbi:hypothetical protein FJTKL_10127 [Diaporthe vaccinii]|uniref:Uncharacterized protein n=1 Tax=Diaporthe vaccinii TaxID=105482 RepID=A0ABR4ELC7_9PEZI